MTLMLAQLVKAAVLVIGLVVLSRLLSPSDFGFVAVPMAIVGVGEIVRDLGISTATTTARVFNDAIRDVLFWINVGLGVLLAACMTGGGALFALSHGETAFIGVSAVLASVFVSNGVGAQYRAGLARDLRFRSLAAADASGAIVGIATAVSLATLGAGYWAIVAQQVTVSVFTVMILVAQGRWVPRLPRWTPEVVPILRFGLSVSWSQALLYLGNNADTFALGFTATAYQRGQYVRSFQMAVQPFGLIKAPMTSVALPLLARKTEDARGYERAVLVGQSLIAYTIVPLAVLMSACAEPVVFIFLGDQWSAAVPIVAALSIAAAIQQLVSVSSWMMISKNLGKALSSYTAFSVIVKVIVIVVVAPYGPKAVAFGYLAAMIVTGPVAVVWACRATHVSASAVFAKMLSPVMVCLVAGGASSLSVSLVAEASHIVGLSVGVAAFAVVYGLSAVIAPVRRDLRDVASLIRPR